MEDGQLSYTGALAGRLGGTVYPALRRLKQQELPQIRGGTARYLQNGVPPADTRTDPPRQVCLTAHCSATAPSGPL